MGAFPPGLPVTDSVADLPLALGGNAQYSEDAGARALGALLFSYKLLFDGSSHSNYGCVTCGEVDPNSQAGQLKAIFYTPTLIDENGKTQVVR